MTSAPYRPSYLAADDVIAAYTSCFLGVLMMPEAVKAGWNGEKSYKETRGAWN